ncbi:MAG: hypothetical protein IJC96_07090, partial [Clostridia bacterium]|nr:hypothetical protein [Clostridia bacterium]
MLGRLLKYEFRATGRTYLPLFGLLLFFTVSNRISMGYSLNQMSEMGRLPVEHFDRLQGVLLFVYVMSLVIIAAA